MTTPNRVSTGLASKKEEHVEHIFMIITNKIRPIPLLKIWKIKSAFVLSFLSLVQKDAYTFLRLLQQNKTKKVVFKGN